MKLSDFDYELPEDAIAQAPLDDRSASKLLWLHRETGKVEDRAFTEVVEILEPGDLLVVNDTRVTALRVFGDKPTGGRVELLLLKEVGPGEYECLARPGRRLRTGSEILLEGGIRAVVAGELPEGRKRVRLHASREEIERVGQIPLPPYIRRELREAGRYQTVYASAAGSAAAPTAGLHFTPGILDFLTTKGVGLAKVTLDVGLDTFRPITDEDPSNHPIHGERCSVPDSTAAAIAAAKRRIIAVGTTTVRTLESFAVGSREVRPGSMDTRLFITPESERAFQVIDGMFTNFHLPRTTMLLMISALAGRQAIMAAYAHALKQGYRFLSFGDSMLIL